VTVGLREYHDNGGTGADDVVGIDGVGIGGVMGIGTVGVDERGDDLDEVSRMGGRHMKEVDCIGEYEECVEELKKKGRVNLHPVKYECGKKKDHSSGSLYVQDCIQEKHIQQIEKSV
jgi:hypothetical protein